MIINDYSQRLDEDLPDKGNKDWIIFQLQRPRRGRHVKEGKEICDKGD